MPDHEQIPPAETDVIPVYANNVRFEMSAWDLRMFFGQLEPGAQDIDWHTDVSVPWAQAKLMHLFLEINLALYEQENGPIKIPTRVMPPAMTTPPETVDQSDPQAVESFRIVQKLMNEFRQREQKQS